MDALYRLKQTCRNVRSASGTVSYCSRVVVVRYKRKWLCWVYSIVRTAIRRILNDMYVHCGGDESLYGPQRKDVADNQLPNAVKACCVQRGRERYKCIWLVSEAHILQHNYLNEPDAKEHPDGLSVRRSNNEIPYIPSCHLDHHPHVLSETNFATSLPAILPKTAAAVNPLPPG